MRAFKKGSRNIEITFMSDYMKNMSKEYWKCKSRKAWSLKLKIAYYIK